MGKRLKVYGIVGIMLGLLAAYVVADDAVTSSKDALVQVFEIRTDKNTALDKARNILLLNINYLHQYFQDETYNKIIFSGQYIDLINANLSLRVENGLNTSTWISTNVTVEAKDKKIRITLTPYGVIKNQAGDKDPLAPPSDNEMKAWKKLASKYMENLVQYISSPVADF